ncbi:MAG: GH32 C-terminal domain-containing protein [Caldilineaceae bacterium]
MTAACPSSLTGARYAPTRLRSICRKAIWFVCTFLDKSVVEVFVNDGAHVITQVIYPNPEDRQIWAYARTAPQGSPTCAWELSSIW